MAEIGSVLDNKYEILTEIGRGGMSVVYLALDRRLNKQWAVKEVQKHNKDGKGEIMAQSLLVETEMLKQLDHPLIPRIVDIIEDEDTIFVVMDYMTGQSLDKVLLDNGPLPEQDVITIGIQLCEALDYLHTRPTPIIYRDMKPANVMLKDPETKAIELFDFGIAREYKEGKTGDTTLLGTPGFASPEQYRRGKQTDARSDIFSLGVTLYNLVTGHNPGVDGQLYPIRHWNPALSGGLEQIIYKCTQAEPESRYQTCQELKYALENYEIFDEEFRRRQRSILNRFLVPAVLSVVFAVLGVVFMGFSKYMTNGEYDQLVAQAAGLPKRLDQWEEYDKAISSDPSRPEAYLGLIECFKNLGAQEDGDGSLLFDQEEAESFKQSFTDSNLEELRESSPEDYANVCYEVGKLYWVYYSYGSTQDRQIMASTWFDRVVTTCEEEGISGDDLELARIYCAIADAQQEIAANAAEGEQSDFRAYWEVLVSLREYMSESSEPDRVKWDAYLVLANALNNRTNMSGFSSGGTVSEAELEDMLNAIRSDIDKLPAEIEILEEIRENVLNAVCEGGPIERNIETYYQS